MSGLDISERRKPQSGKIRFRRWGRLDLELRLETYPTSSGDEDAVLRLLTPGKVKMLSEIGLTRRNQDLLESLLRKPFGLFLCVGATGSGKTTTLHSALSLLNDGTLKIVTAEDPVEITQAGIRQMQVKPKIGLDFTEALRSFLRADPDVIMIGEIRDPETARTAVEASLTGHLVLSTLHTNTAPETISRLLDLEINPFTFSDALLGILAQRLIRRLCTKCRKPYTKQEILAILEKEYQNAEGFEKLISERQPNICAPNNEPCDQCNGSGYKGRLAIHELLAMTPVIQEMIIKKASANQLREKAIQENMRTFRQDGIEKILAGETTVEEVLAAAIH
jgi:type II secretory ATPase GspE/PulE/Tfp pilus assembly ATPase PilB-like protein